MDNKTNIYSARGCQRVELETCNKTKKKCSKTDIGHAIEY